MEPIFSVVSLIDSYFTVLLSVPSQHFTYTLQPLVRDGPLENLWGGGRAKYKKKIRAREN